MKTIALCLFLPVLFACQLRADFVIVQKIESPMQNGEMTIYMKGAKTRVDVSPAISIISDGATGDSLTLMHSERRYMRISGKAMNAMQEQLAKMQSDRGQTAPPQLIPTGRKEVINGYKTEEFTSTMGGMKVSYWIARDFSQFHTLLAQMLKVQEKGVGQPGRHLMPRPEEFPGMPLRTITEFNGQKMVTTVVSVTERNVDANLFQAPPGYTEAVMPAFKLPQQKPPH